MVSRGLAALSQAVRVRVLAKHVGELSLSLGGLAAVPGIVGLVTGRLAIAAVYGGGLVALLIVGLMCNRLNVPQQVQRNEALVATVMAFLLAVVQLSAGFVVEGLSVADALFEAVSSITTTGLTTLDHIEGRSVTFLLARA